MKPIQGGSWIYALVIVAFAATAAFAQVAQFTTGTANGDGLRTNVLRYMEFKVNYVTNASGLAEFTVDENITGKIDAIAHIPVSATTSAERTILTVVDREGQDVLRGTGTLSATNAVSFATGPFLPLVSSPLICSVSIADATRSGGADYATGTLRIWVSR